MPTKPSERTIIFLVSAIQFVNIVDFMMVMPMGPDFAKALNIDVSHLGYIGGSYTAAAAVAGVASSFFVERFDRRKALAVAMLGLVIGTGLGALALDFTTLLLARIVAGSFGGPATSLSMSVIADVIPPARRGRAMGAVMGAFAAASAFGVPAGLYLARTGGWRAPFLAVAALGLVIAAISVFMLPPMTGHIEAAKQQKQTGVAELLGRPVVRVAYLVTAIMMMGGFAIIPNISGYLQLNLGFAREKIESVYMVGGLVSFVTARLSGRAIDKFGAFRTGTVGTIAFVAVVAQGFVPLAPMIGIYGTFLCFFIAQSFRMLPYSTLMTLVPGPAERARFMSLLSGVQHIASASGAMLSAQLLTESPDHKLVGMSHVALMTIALSIVVPAFLWYVERHVRAARPPTPMQAEPT